jgi:hypothetical protein
MQKRLKHCSYHSSQAFRGSCAANGSEVFEASAAVEERLVWRGKPPDAKAGRAQRLGHTAQRNGMGIAHLSS